MNKELKTKIDNFISELYIEKTEEEKIEIGSYLLENIFEGTELVSFQELSDNGLIWKINKEILHPLGLALTRDADLNISRGAIKSKDGTPYHYSEVSDKANAKKWKNSKYRTGELNGKT